MTQQHNPTNKCARTDLLKCRAVFGWQCYSILVLVGDSEYLVASGIVESSEAGPCTQHYQSRRKR